MSGTNILGITPASRSRRSLAPATLRWSAWRDLACLAEDWGLLGRDCRVPWRGSLLPAAAVQKIVGRLNAGQREYLITGLMGCWARLSPCSGPLGDAQQLLHQAWHGPRPPRHGGRRPAIHACLAYRTVVVDADPGLRSGQALRRHDGGRRPVVPSVDSSIVGRRLSQSG